MYDVKGRKGYSLLEVLVAMAILMIGIIGTYRMFPISMRNAQKAKELVEASELAASRLDQLRAGSVTDAMVYGFTDPASEAWDASYTNGTPDIVPVDMFRSDYVCKSYATTLQKMDGASGTGLQRAVFTVRMNDGRDETFVTYIVEP